DLFHRPRLPGAVRHRRGPLAAEKAGQKAQDPSPGSSTGVRYELQLESAWVGKGLSTYNRAPRRSGILSRRLRPGQRVRRQGIADLRPCTLVGRESFPDVAVR